MSLALTALKGAGTVPIIMIALETVRLNSLLTAFPTDTHRLSGQTQEHLKTQAVLTAKIATTMLMTSIIFLATHGLTHPFVVVTTVSTALMTSSVLKKIDDKKIDFNGRVEEEAIHGRLSRTLHGVPFFLSAILALTILKRGF